MNTIEENNAAFGKRCEAIVYSSEGKAALKAIADAKRWLREQYRQAALAHWKENGNSATTGWGCVPEQAYSPKRRPSDCARVLADELATHASERPDLAPGLRYKGQFRDALNSDSEDSQEMKHEFKPHSINAAQCAFVVDGKLCPLHATNPAHVYPVHQPEVAKCPSCGNAGTKVGTWYECEPCNYQWTPIIEESAAVEKSEVERQQKLQAEVDDATIEGATAVITSYQEREKALVEMVSRLVETVESMRGEFRLHGQITDASSEYLHHVEPAARALLRPKENGK